MTSWGLLQRHLGCTVEMAGEAVGVAQQGKASKERAPQGARNADTAVTGVIVVGAIGSSVAALAEALRAFLLACSFGRGSLGSRG